MTEQYINRLEEYLEAVHQNPCKFAVEASVRLNGLEHWLPVDLALPKILGRWNDANAPVSLTEAHVQLARVRMDAIARLRMHTKLRMDIRTALGTTDRTR
eukprot:1122030-Amphidinium_carterae.1